MSTPFSAKKVVGKGSREETRPGVWRVRHNLGYDPISKRYVYSPWRTIHTTSKRELNAFAEDYKHELNAGMDVVAGASRVSVSSYLDLYHKGRKDLVKATYFSREDLLVREAQSLLGDTRLDAVSPTILRAVYTNAREKGILSESELFMVHALIKRALQQAVNDDLIAKNPASAVKVAQPEYKHRRSLTADEAKAFKRALLEEEACPHVVATLLLLETGCRRGEVLGLVWENVSLETRRVNIRQQLTSDGAITSPKSKMSRRQIAIGDRTADYLAAWKDAQSAALTKKGLKQTGKTFVANALQDVVVIGDDGQPALDEAGGPVVRLRDGHLDPHNFDRWFRNFCVDNGFGTYTKNVREKVYAGKRLVRGSGYEGITPHSLRHTQATLLIGNGTDWKTVQARLGHRDPSFTVRQYADAIESNDDKAAKDFDAIVDNEGAGKTS